MSGGFVWLECPDCGWSCILASADAEGDEICPMCAEDNGRDVPLDGRPAHPEDVPEGRDARRAADGQ